MLTLCFRSPGREMFRVLVSGVVSGVSPGADSFDRLAYCKSVVFAPVEHSVPIISTFFKTGKNRDEINGYIHAFSQLWLYFPLARRNCPEDSATVELFFGNCY